LIEEKVRKAIILHRHELLKKKNVVGFSEIPLKKIKNGKELPLLCLRIYVSKKIPEDLLSKKDLVPTSIEGAITDVVEVGEIRSPPPKSIDTEEPVDRKKRRRPAPGGISYGHYAITAGTKSCMVKKPSGEVYTLSNSHVAANTGKGKEGDPVLQPGPYDGGAEARDTIDTLSEYVPISFQNKCMIANTVLDVLNTISRFLKRKTRFSLESDNLVDAAISRPINLSDHSFEILSLGKPKGFRLATVGMLVLKSGRTTGTTSGIIRDIDATITVSYGELGSAVFIHQILTDKMVEGGDSGSLLEDQEGYAVGLLFAGSDQVSIANRIQNVSALLNVEIAEGR